MLHDYNTVSVYMDNFTSESWNNRAALLFRVASWENVIFSVSKNQIEFGFFSLTHICICFFEYREERSPICTRNFFRPID